MANKQNGFGKKIKDAFNISLLSKLLIIVIIVISTLFPTLFNPEGADWRKVLSNFILSVVIMMGAFLSQMISAKKKGTEKDNYKTSSKNHIDKIHEIQNRSLSHFHKLYVKDENKRNEIEYCKDAFQQFEIDFKYYDMDLTLVKTALKSGFIDKEQYSVIQLCRKGQIQYDKYDVRDLVATQVLKKGQNTNKSQQASITASNLLSKMSFMLAFAIIWGMFVWDESSASGVSNGQAWIDLCSRLFTFVGGLWTGEVTGKEIIDDDIRLFDKFYNFNSKFIQDFDNGIWKPVAEEVTEDIVEKLRKIQAAENDSINNVTEQEVVEEIEVSEEEYQKMMHQNK